MLIAINRLSGRFSLKSEITMNQLIDDRLTADTIVKPYHSSVVRVSPESLLCGLLAQVVRAQS